MVLKIGIVGGGLVGLGTALKIRAILPKAAVVVWEKEKIPGSHQSTHNSGVLHAGLYYKPGSLKARLAVEGIREMVAFCRDQNVPHDICGKLVVATTEDELTRLKVLFDRGRANGLQGLEWLQKERIAEFEPHATGVAAVRVPEEGIVDYQAVVSRLVVRLLESGVSIRTGAQVLGMRRAEGQWRLETMAGDDTCTFLINCAGLYSDRVAELAGEKRETRIVPFRGEYYKLRPERTHLVKNLIYPVPDASFPFLGVHFTRLIRGGVEAGPNAVLAFSREGYSKSAVNVRDLVDALGFIGLWRFLQRHKRMCWEEARRSYNRHRFCVSLQRLVPEVCEEDLVPGDTGVRAQAMTPSGDLVQDFSVIERPDAVHVLNAPSPAATASLAIGGHIARQVAQLVR